MELDQPNATNKLKTRSRSATGNATASTSRAAKSDPRPSFASQSSNAEAGLSHINRSPVKRRLPEYEEPRNAPIASTSALAHVNRPQRRQNDGCIPSPRQLLSPPISRSLSPESEREDPMFKHLFAGFQRTEFNDYGKEYRTLQPKDEAPLRVYIDQLNRNAAAAARRFVRPQDVYDTEPDPETDDEATQFCSALWTPRDKELFFHSLARHSKLRPDLVAKDLPGKSHFDVVTYLNYLDRISKELYSNTHAEAAPIPFVDLPSAREPSEMWLRRERDLSTHAESFATHAKRFKHAHETLIATGNYTADPNDPSSKPKHGNLKRSKVLAQSTNPTIREEILDALTPTQLFCLQGFFSSGIRFRKRDRLSALKSRWEVGRRPLVTTVDERGKQHYRPVNRKVGTYLRNRVTKYPKEKPVAPKRKRSKSNVLTIVPNPFDPQPDANVLISPPDSEHGSDVEPTAKRARFKKREMRAHSRVTDWREWVPDTKRLKDYKEGTRAWELYSMKELMRRMDFLPDQHGKLRSDLVGDAGTLLRVGGLGQSVLNMQDGWSSPVDSVDSKAVAEMYEQAKDYVRRLMSAAVDIRAEDPTQFTLAQGPTATSYILEAKKRNPLLRPSAHQEAAQQKKQKKNPPKTRDWLQMDRDEYPDQPLCPSEPELAHPAKLTDVWEEWITPRFEKMKEEITVEGLFSKEKSARLESLAAAPTFTPHSRIKPFAERPPMKDSNEKSGRRRRDAFLEDLSYSELLSYRKEEDDDAVARVEDDRLDRAVEIMRWEDIFQDKGRHWHEARRLFDRVNDDDRSDTDSDIGGQRWVENSDEEDELDSDTSSIIEDLPSQKNPFKAKGVRGPYVPIVHKTSKSHPHHNDPVIPIPLEDRRPFYNARPGTKGFRPFRELPNNKYKSKEFISDSDDY